MSCSTRCNTVQYRYTHAPPKPHNGNVPNANDQFKRRFMTYSNATQLFLSGSYPPLCPATRSCSNPVFSPLPASSSSNRLASSSRPSFPQYSAFSVP